MAEKKTIELEIKSNLDSAQQSVSGLRTQLRNAQAEVAILSDKFGATSKEAVNAAKKAAELRDRIGDAKALTEAFNPDAKFRALSGSLAGVAGGFSAVTGLMGALGSESKEVEQAILKVQSAMAIASGLQTLGESIDQFKILATVIKNTSLAQKALTIYQSTYTYVMAATTTGLKLLRGAMIATGDIDMVFFFFDPMEAQPHDSDVKALLRLAVAWNLPMACDRTTADFLVTSPFMQGEYEYELPNYTNYLNRKV